MLELHTLPRAWGLATFTPFGLKVMAYLRLAEIPFVLVVENNPGRGPKGKLPWIVDNGRAIGDSGFIVEHLAREYGDRVDAWLSPSQRATAHAVRRMIEESFCFAILHTRWVDDAAYRELTAVLFANVPRPLRALLPALVRRRLLRDLWGQGIGRHDSREACQLGGQDLVALAECLGDKAYLLGDRPASVDASAYAFLAVILFVPIDTPLKNKLREHRNLTAYCERMHKTFFVEHGDGSTGDRGSRPA
jgi:glutathione S-transferase